MPAADPFYFYNTQHTINTVTAYKLMPTTAGASANTIVGNYIGNRIMTIKVVHADGSKDTLATNVCTNTDSGAGLRSSTWASAETSLAGTDAIEIVVSQATYDGFTRTWITEQLNWALLKASTWTFARWMDQGSGYFQQWPPMPGYSYYWGSMHYGSGGYNTRISGWEYDDGEDRAYID